MFLPLRQQHVPGLDGGVGLAWQKMPLPGTNYSIIDKSGSVPGFVSYIAFVPETGIGVVVLMNSATSHPYSNYGT